MTELDNQASADQQSAPAASPNTVAPQPGGSTTQIGLVDGSTASSTRDFKVVLADDATVGLDELVVTRQTLPDGSELTHYGIVTEGWGEIEGADMSSDTHRITGTHTMPGATVRTVDATVLRTIPEKWLPPDPGAVVQRAAGADRANALFVDQMERRLPIGLDMSNQPLYADFDFINGTKGGHVSISGVSGVATKTSFAMFLLYMLFETRAGRELLGPQAANARALVFNVKGEDLLHLDRPNAVFGSKKGAREQWAALGVTGDELAAFQEVTVFAPRAAGADGQVVPTVTSRPAADLTVYGWTPWDFIREGLLRFIISEDDDRNTQVGMVEQRCRTQLARWAHPVAGRPGAVVLRAPDARTPFVFERVVAEYRPDVRQQNDDVLIENFSDLVEFLSQRIELEDPEWMGRVASTTGWAFLRRLHGMAPRLGQLISTGVQRVRLESSVNVVDISSLHDSAQRFVVGALLSAVFAEKVGAGREPLRFIVLDELNKYAPAQGKSPIKDVLVDIAARGRSLGVLLIGAQQAAGDVDGNITRNAAVKVVGRLDAGEADSYRFLTPAVRERAARFLPGTMVVDQPLIPAPLPLRFPFPPYATNIAEAARPAANVAADAQAAAPMLQADPDEPPPF